MFTASAARGTPAAATPTPENPRVSSEDWMSWHAAVLRKVATDGKPAVAFFGDSVLVNWVSEGESPWRAHLEPLGAVNYAIPASVTQNLLWHLQNGGLENRPRVAVVQIGINNLGLGDPPQEVSEGVTAILREFRRRSPQTQVIVLALFPPNVSPERMDFRLAVDQANALIEPMATRLGARFVNVNGALTDASGTPRDDLYLDGVHLSEAGYEAIAGALAAPILEELRGRTPVRPSPPGRSPRPHLPGVAMSRLPVVASPPARWFGPAYLRGLGLAGRY